jgi:hypothetical protein
VRRILPGLVAVATLLLMPAGGAAGAAHPAYAGKAGDPNYHKPTVGDCHDYDLAGLYQQSDTSPIVDCATTHTAMVMHVFMLPDTLSWSDTDAVGRLVSKRCRPAWEELLGRSELTRALTAYSRGWFRPTKAERDQGARWLRCDVIAYGGNTDLAPLPYVTAPLIPNPITDDVRKCLTGKFYSTTCIRSHVWRSAGDFNLRTGKYPTSKQMRAIAIKKCSPMVTSSRFYYLGPTKDAWKTGYRVMVCFSKNKH